MQFDAQDYPYASKRHVVYARNGMVCAGNPTATAAGLKTLLKGGNAVDAAVTVASTLPVVEPTGNGLGADCFAIIWYKGKMYGINASGPAPKAAHDRPTAHSEKKSLFILIQVMVEIVVSAEIRAYGPSCRGDRRSVRGSGCRRHRSARSFGCR